MIRKTLILAALVAFPILGTATKAQAAEEYCREYTKTVSIGGRAEQAYGTACYRPDGSWEIVDIEGSDYGREQVRNVMYNDLQHDYNRTPYRKVVVVERHDRPVYHPRYSYNRARHYSSSPFVFNFAFGERNDRDDHKSKKVSYKNDRYDRHDHGRRDHR